MKYYLVLNTALAVCGWCSGSHIFPPSVILGQLAEEVAALYKVPASSKNGDNIVQVSLILGHQHAVEVAGENKVPATCKVAPHTNYYKVAIELGQKCKSRVGATDSDIEAIATYHPINTEVLKKLIHCEYQTYNSICGDTLADIAHISWAYVLLLDGDPLKFVNVVEKIQEMYNAGKKFDGEDGIEAVTAMHSCFLNQSIQDDKIRAES